ncbi:hypothetical protein [Steroidobacter cummioxidans]|uniref:hypothetical protein n=1 Tax=Steroidobacter cummioxidans TaxID=1803913 RepID=UPI000E31AD0E|nr:hypothetical protein [Steroidobacter cummioxidans]
MIGYLRSLFVGLCLISAAVADDAPNSAHTPPESPFRASGPETLEWAKRDFIEYQGRATISAKYRFVYFDGNSDDDPGYSQNPHLFLLPNQEAQATLPYLTRWVYERDDSQEKVLWTERAERIWVTNVADAAAGLLGEQLAAEVLAGKHETVVGEAVVVIDGFSAGYECDSPSFATRFVAVKHEISAPSVAKRGVGGC